MGEYPHLTPNGEQTDLAESMSIENGVISRHRVYRGWIGLKNLHSAANNITERA